MIFGYAFSSFQTILRLLLVSKKSRGFVKKHWDGALFVETTPVLVTRRAPKSMSFVAIYNEQSPFVDLTKLDYFNPVVGLTTIGGPGYELNTVTKHGKQRQQNLSKHRLTHETLINPPDAVVKEVHMLRDPESALLVGIKFFDIDGTCLLAIGSDDTNTKVVFTLTQNERIVGIGSCQDNNLQCCVKFIIGRII